MARHANGKNTYAVAGWVIAVAVIAAVALIAALVWALTRGGSGTDDAAQAEGSVAASKAGSQDAASAATSETKTESGSESAEPATSSSKAPASSTAPASTGSADTLLLLDTSDALAPNFDPVTGAAADAAQSLGEKNKQVALWNYSSPINPGVQVGYRTNLNFGPGADAAGAVTQFGTGGVPQTRSAVIAAVQAASDHSQQTNDTTRVLVVTTDTKDDLDDKAFADALKDAKGDKVQLSVVHLGKDGADEQLEAAADGYSTVDTPGDKKAVSQALREAAGI